MEPKRRATAEDSGWLRPGPEEQEGRVNTSLCAHLGCLSPGTPRRKQAGPKVEGLDLSCHWLIPGSQGTGS